MFVVVPDLCEKMPATIREGWWCTNRSERQFRHVLFVLIYKGFTRGLWLTRPNKSDPLRTCKIKRSNVWLRRGDSAMLKRDHVRISRSPTSRGATSTRCRGRFGAVWQGDRCMGWWWFTRGESWCPT